MNDVTVTGFALLMALVLGAIVASGEFRHQTATLTHLQVPRRDRVLVAKMVASAIAGLFFGAAGAAATTGVTVAFLAGHGDELALAGATLARYAGGAVLGAALLGALGAALGSLVRSQLGEVIGVLVWAFFAESVAGGFFDNLGPYLPFTAATTLAGSRLGGGGFGYGGTSSAAPLSFAAAAARVAVTAVVLALAAAGTTVRRDIT